MLLFLIRHCVPRPAPLNQNDTNAHPHIVRVSYRSRKDGKDDGQRGEDRMMIKPHGLLRTPNEIGKTSFAFGPIHLPAKRSTRISGC